MEFIYLFFVTQEIQSRKSIYRYPHFLGHPFQHLILVAATLCMPQIEKKWHRTTAWLHCTFVGTMSNLCKRRIILVELLPSDRRKSAAGRRKSSLNQLFNFHILSQFWYIISIFETCLQSKDFGGHTYVMLHIFIRCNYQMYTNGRTPLLYSWCWSGC